MKNVNLLIKVSDDLYQDVVEPKKREKSFTSFMESLINSYYTNSAVQSIVEGSIDGIKEESMKSLNDALLKAKSSMSRLSLFADELESTTLEGESLFSDYGESDTGLDMGSSTLGENTLLMPVGEEKPQGGAIKTPVSEEYEGLREEVSSLKSQNEEIREQNRQILEMLGNLTALGKMGVSSPVKSESPLSTESTSKSDVSAPEVASVVAQKPVPEVSVSNADSSEEELLDFGVDFDALEAQEEEEKDDFDADAIFNGFMQNNQFEF